MRTFADGIRRWVGGPYRVLGTDGFGRSDWRRSLRDFFEVDRRHIALAALTSLAEEGEVDAKLPRQAIERYEIDAERPAPWKV
jgi:pyruvate dehydrogenase E1 component